MRSSIVKISEDRTFLDAVRLLMETSQRALPVVDANDAIIGLVSEGDLINSIEPDPDASASSLTLTHRLSDQSLNRWGFCSWVRAISDWKH